MSKRAWFLFGAVLAGGILLQILDTIHQESHAEAGAHGHGMAETTGEMTGGAMAVGESASAEAVDGPKTVTLAVTGMT